MERLVTEVHILYPSGKLGCNGCAAVQRVMPAPKGIAKSVGQTIPELHGMMSAWSPPHVSLALTYHLEKAVTYNSSQRVVTLGVPERCPGPPREPGCSCDVNNNASSTFHAGVGIAPRPLHQALS